MFPSTANKYSVAVSDRRLIPAAASKLPLIAGKYKVSTTDKKLREPTHSQDDSSLIIPPALRALKFPLPGPDLISGRTNPFNSPVSLPQINVQEWVASLEEQWRDRDYSRVVSDLNLSLLCHRVDGLFKYVKNDMSSARYFKLGKKIAQQPNEIHYFYSRENVRTYVVLESARFARGGFKWLSKGLCIEFFLDKLPRIFSIAQARPLLNDEDVHEDFQREWDVSHRLQPNKYALVYLDFWTYSDKNGKKQSVLYSHLFVYNLFNYVKDGFINKLSKPQQFKEDVFRSLLQGLFRIHEKGMVHGDIKHSNILIDGCLKQIKYCDFGNVVLKNQFQSRGTPDLLAFEVFENTNRASLQSEKLDIWALGCTLYYVHHQRSPKWCTPLGIYFSLNREIEQVEKRKEISDRKEAKGMSAPCSPEIDSARSWGSHTEDQLKVLYDYFNCVTSFSKTKTKTKPLFIYETKKVFFEKLRVLGDLLLNEHPPYSPQQIEYLEMLKGFFKEHLQYVLDHLRKGYLRSMIDPSKPDVKFDKIIAGMLELDPRSRLGLQAALKILEGT